MAGYPVLHAYRVEPVSAQPEPLPPMIVEPTPVPAVTLEQRVAVIEETLQKLRSALA